MALWVMPGLGASCFNLSEKTCNATSGCYYKDWTCSACRGEYDNSDPTDGKTGPNSCYSLDKTSLGEKRTYADGAVEYKCVENATVVDGQCQCVEYYQEKEGKCTPKVMNLFFCSTQRDGDCDPLHHSGAFNLVVKYGVGFYRYKDDTTSEGAVETDKIPETIRTISDNEMPWRNVLGDRGSQFLGFYETNKADAIQPQIGRIFDSQGNFVVSEQTASKYFFEQNKNLVYPRFYPRAKIKYSFKNVDFCNLTKECGLDNCVPVVKYMDVLQADRYCKYDMNGRLFRGWECDGINEKIFESGQNATEIVQDGKRDAWQTVNCYAKVDDCTPGHYCAENVQYDCPTGTTSKSKSSKKSQCFINQETRFCDKVGCFSLPISNGTVYYQEN